MDDHDLNLGKTYCKESSLVAIQMRNSSIVFVTVIFLGIFDSTLDLAMQISSQLWISMIG
jgi:hypothetical protein